MTTVGLGPKTVQRPEKEHTDRYHNYTWRDDDDEDLLGLDMSAYLQKPDGYSMPLSFIVWHQEGTYLDSLKLELKPGANFDHPVIMHWETPNRNWPETEFGRTERFGMVFEVPDLGEYGRGTVTSDFVGKVPTNGETIKSLPVWLNAEFELSEGMVGGYDLSVEDEFEIPVQRWQ